MKGEGCGGGDVGVGMLTRGNARSMGRGQWVKGLSRDNQTTEREQSSCECMVSKSTSKQFIYK